jgi:hypothetical protein
VSLFRFLAGDTFFLTKIAKKGVPRSIYLALHFQIVADITWMPSEGETLA